MSKSEKKARQTRDKVMVNTLKSDADSSRKWEKSAINTTKTAKSLEGT